MPRHRPCQRESVERRGAAAHFVHQNQAVARGVVKNVGGLRHLHHERGPPTGQVVGRADAGKDRIDRPEARRFRRHEAAAVRQQHDQRRLPHVGALAAHVGSGDEQQLSGWRKAQIVRHEAVDLMLDDEMTAAFYFDRFVCGECWARQRACDGARERRQYIELGKRAGKLSKAGMSTAIESSSCS